MSTPAKMDVAYYPGDLRRRDVPGMIDALFHCLEHGGFVKDDSLIKDVTWQTFPVDRANPRVNIVLEFSLEDKVQEVSKKLSRQK